MPVSSSTAAGKRHARPMRSSAGRWSSGCNRGRLVFELLERRNLLTVSLGAQFGGMNENEASWYPLQITAAEGPHYVVDVAGGQMAIYTTSGQFLENQPMTAYFGGSGGNGDNPTVVYDPTVAGGGRYIVCNGVSTVYFGISKTSDPTQGWYWYTLTFPDSGDGGRFGFNNSAYFVWYSSESSSSVANTIVIQKTSILSGGSMTSYSQISPAHPTLQVDDALSYGSGTGDPAWFYNSTQLIEETNYLSTSPTYTTYSISGGTFATSKYAEIRTINGVETMAGVNDDASITWAVNGVTSLSWSEITVGSTPTVLQSGNIATPSGWSDIGYAYSSLAPNGDIGITFMDATASDTEMGMFVTGRKVSDPAGTMETPIAAFTGTYDFTRVGDYGSVNADINNDTFWATEYSDSHPGYTAIVNFGLSNTPPAVMQPVMGLGAAPSDGTHVNLQWNAVPGATSYEIERSSDGVTFSLVASGLTATSYTDTPSGTISGLYYDVLAYNGQTDSAAPSPIRVTLAPAPPTFDSLSAPTGLAAALAASGTGVALSWNSVTGAAGYAIQRATSNSTWTQIGTTAAATLVYNDTGLTGGQLYYYRVSATDSSSGQSSPSTAVTIVNRPSAPTVTVNTGWANQLQVAWNLIPSATSYTVLRSTDGVNYTTVGTTAADYVTYTDFTVSPNTKYYYEVVADNAAVGNSTAGSASATAYLPTPTGLTITQEAGPLALQWTSVTGATGYQIQRSTDNASFTPIATSTTAGYTDASVTPLTPYYYRVFALDSANGNTSAAATAFSSAPAVTPLPYLWQSQDIGASNIGASGFSNGVYTVDGYGSDIWGTSDQFHFTALPVTNSGTITIVAEVASLSNTGGWAKGGVMIRNSLAANSQYALECITPSNGSAFQYRTSSGGGAGGTGGNSGPVAPYWVKLVKSGNTITGYRSANGGSWTQDGSASITMGSTIYVGLETDSNWNTYAKLIDNEPPDSTPAINTATFSNVVVTTSTSQAPTVATPASASPSPVTGTTTSLSALGADASGAANLYYTWTATSVPSGAAQPTFSANGTNAAQSTTATFYQAGSYTFQVTIANAYGLTVTSSVNVTVNQTLSGGITISPSAAIVNVNATQQFTASGEDQFGQPMGTVSATWSVSPASGAGSINSSSGLYTGPGSQATPTITATSGGNTATATVSVFNRDAFTNSAGGSWATANNWQNGTIASGAGVAADFSTLGLTSAPTVTLDGARTAGDLLFGDTNNSYGWTLNTGTGGPLTLSTTSGTPTIVVTNQSATIGATLAGTQGFNKTGAGKLTLSATPSSAVLSGTVTVSGGTLVATGGGWYAQRSIGSGTLVVNAGASAEFTVAHGFGESNYGEPATLNGGMLIFDHENYVSSLGMTGGTLQGAGETRPVSNLTVTVNAAATTSTIANPTDLAYGNVTFNVASGTAAIGLLVSGLIDGSDNITKSGAGLAVFSDNNSYTGTTTVSGGTLWVNNATGWAIGTGAVAVNSGGTLGGTGAIDGPVTVNSGGTLAPGAGGIGTLTVDNSLALHGATAIQMNASTSASDLVTGMTTLTYGGTLTVTNLAGTFAAGQTFSLFSASSYSGSFSSVNLPSLGPSLGWDTSKLAVNGTISVAVTGTATVATPAAANYSGGTTVALSVLGADAAGQQDLTYTWSATGPASVAFSPNGTNAAQSSTATLSAAGTYTFTATIADVQGPSTTSSVTVTISQNLTSFAIAPPSVTLNTGTSQQFAATAKDQFGNAITNPAVIWSMTGGGSLGANGLYQGPEAEASATVSAVCGSFNSSATVSIPGQPAWSATTSGSWSTAGNWQDSSSKATIAAPGLRGLAGGTALFATAAGTTASLDGASPTLAAVIFNSNSAGYTIAVGSGGTLHLNNGNSPASLVVQNGRHTISAPVALDNSVIVAPAAGSQLSISGAISGEGSSLTVDGGGTLVLSGSNSYTGGTTVTAGRLVIASNSALGLGSLVVGSAAGLFDGPAAPEASAAVAAPAQAAVLKVASPVMAPAAIVTTRTIPTVAAKPSGSTAAIRDQVFAADWRWESAPAANFANFDDALPQDNRAHKLVDAVLAEYGPLPST
jgi:autotransporter-associated beta strand protein